MPTFANEIIREVRKDFAQKSRLAQGVAPHINLYGFDAEELQSMSAHEFALRCLRELKKRGLIDISETGDPVGALEAYCAGSRDAAARDTGLPRAPMSNGPVREDPRERGRALDGRETFMSRYLNSAA